MVELTRYLAIFTLICNWSVLVLTVRLPQAGYKFDRAWSSSKLRTYLARTIPKHAHRSRGFVCCSLTSSSHPNRPFRLGHVMIMRPSILRFAALMSLPPLFHYRICNFLIFFEHG
ncbi:hypothetical protein DFH06DRAFT_1252348 [Mycena polygramma]|nr:hypothetical protein DFH06DRAFT_1252348 [Mycena polygramma]